MEYISSAFKYLFNSNPGTAFEYYVPLLILASVLVISSIIFSAYYKKRKKVDFAFKRLFKSLSNRLMLFGILLFVLIAVRYENIPYFSMRIWLYILLLVLLYFIYRYLKVYKVKYPKEKANANSKKQQTKTGRLFKADRLPVCRNLQALNQHRSDTGPCRRKSWKLSLELFLMQSNHLHGRLYSRRAV